MECIYSERSRVLALRFSVRIWTILRYNHLHIFGKDMDIAERLRKEVDDIGTCIVAKFLDSSNHVPTNSRWACGFYVVQNIMEFTKARGLNSNLCVRLIPISHTKQPQLNN